MSFPYHDAFWCEAASFVENRAARQVAILAPDIFWWRFPKIYRYINTRLEPDREYDWIILHKGQVEELPREFLIRCLTDLVPVFANEVFVILARTNSIPALPDDDPHLVALTNRMVDLEKTPEKQIPEGLEPVLPNRGAIFKFSELDEREFEIAMDEFWANGGYKYESLRDRAYYQEIDRSIRDFIGQASGKKMLDVACGIGRCGNIVSPKSQVVGIDISRVAIELAKESHHDKPNFAFEHMDAHHLAFPQASFDAVLFIDAIEHVRDSARVFSEISRVVKPEGLVLVTVANRDSVNQVLTRKLGYPEFVTNYLHIREFSYGETRAILTDHGFRIQRERGIFLYPYWGIPGVDEVVRQVTDDDPEFVELMRLLGERVGAEHAYCSVVLARKTDLIQN